MMGQGGQSSVHLGAINSIDDMVFCCCDTHFFHRKRRKEHPTQSDHWTAPALRNLTKTKGSSFAALMYVTLMLGG